MAGGNGVGYYFYCSTGCTPTGWKFMASPSNGPGTSGQVLTSAGSGAAPTWTTPGTGGRPSQWGTESGGTMNWPTCATTCANSTEGGFNDWYMPSVAEWFELNESVPDGTFNGYCWTSTGGSAANFYTMIPNGTGWWLLDYTTNEYCRCIR